MGANSTNIRENIVHNNRKNLKQYLKIKKSMTAFLLREKVFYVKKKVAPPIRLERITVPLTAECSTIELQGISFKLNYIS